MTAMHDLEPAAHQLTELVKGVTDDELSAPTPCEQTSVAGLLDHLMGLTLAFTYAARKSHGAVTGSPPPQASGDTLDPQWRTRLPEHVNELVTAWRDPAAWEGMAQAGGVTLPAEIMGNVVVDELVLHGWDLARATSQDFSCDPASTEVVFGFTSSMSKPGEEASRAGLFGPVVEVPQDASLFDRALGFSGRDPSWRPARP